MDEGPMELSAAIQSFLVNKEKTAGKEIFSTRIKKFQ
jgi:hypothetical protein